MRASAAEIPLFEHTRSIATDRRRIDYTPQPELRRRAGELVAELRRVELELGSVLAQIDASRAHVEVGAASVEQLASRLGLAPEEARRYRDLGRAVAVQPSVGERVAERALPTTRAAVLAPILDGSGEPRNELERELGVRPRWVKIGERTPTRKLRAMVRRELTSRSTGEDVVDMTFHATETTREHFERARVLASRKAGRRLTADQTFRTVVEEYVDANDPLATGEGQRRVGPTSDRPESRYIPVATRRAVRRRADDRCEMPNCDERTFLEFAHRVGHAAGGSREEDNLLLLCWLHHRMLDGGSFRLIGPTRDPAWVDGSGIVCTRRAPGGRLTESDDEERAVRELRARRRDDRTRGEARAPP